MKYALRRTDMPPPGGYRWEESWIASPIIGSTPGDVQERVNAYRVANKQPTITEEDVVQFTCQWLVDHGHPDLVATFKPLNRGLLDYWQGLKAYAEIQSRIMRNQPFTVSPYLSKKRAKVCESCGFNDKFVATNAVENATDAKMRQAIGGLTTPSDDLLGYCGDCKCHLKTLVHFTRDLLGDVASENVPRTCWKASEKPQT